MTEQKGKIKEIIREIDNTNRKDESGTYDGCESIEESRDITKMQAPDSWPDAPDDNNDNKKEK